MNHKISFFVIDHLSVGGVERVTSKLLSLFLDNNLNVFSLISLQDSSKKNNTIIYPKEIDIKTIQKNNLEKSLYTYIVQNKITHLVFQGDNMSISKTILEVCKQANCKAFLHYHGSPYAYLKKNYYFSDIVENPLILIKSIVAFAFYPFKKQKLKKVIKNSSSGFITVSNGVKNEINSLFNTKFKNISCIHNPTSFNETKAITTCKKEKTIILISRLVRKHKNVFLILRSWKLLHQKYPDWNLEILGDGILLKKIKNYINQHKLTNIKLRGNVSNVDDYLKKSSISVITSDTEGFSMFVYESLFFKNPIVSTKSYGGVSDMVVQNYNGLFSPKNDEHKLAKNIELLINDDKLRLKMGQNSYLKHQELQEENIIEEWIKLLNLNDINL